MPRSQPTARGEVRICLAVSQPCAGRGDRPSQPGQPTEERGIYQVRAEGHKEQVDHFRLLLMPLQQPRLPRRQITYSQLVSHSVSQSSQPVKSASQSV
eukprot:4770578-Pyramimonas_sp.AAC.1